jgi:hypothetical protein
LLASAEERAVFVKNSLEFALKVEAHFFFFFLFIKCQTWTKSRLVSEQHMRMRLGALLC